MSPETKNTVFRITRKEKIIRPIAAFAITGAALFSVQKDHENAKIDYPVSSSSHELVMRDDIYSHVEFDIMPTPMLQGPPPPTREEIGREVSDIFSKAIEEKKAADQKAEEAEQAKIAEEIRVAAVNKKIATVLPPISGDVSAASTSGNDSSVWDLLAQCESGGDWGINTGNGYLGGVQQNMQFWVNYGGLEYAPSPDLATREQQIIVAERGLAAQGWGAWSACSEKLGLR